MGAVFLGPASVAEREVDDVRRASIVHEDSFSVESFYIQHYNQRVVVGLFHSSDISFKIGRAHV